MFDLTWGEIGIIVIVAIVVIGPKDLPVVLRAGGKMLYKLKNLAAELKKSFDEALLEDEIRQTKDEMNKGLKQIVDMDGNLQDAYDVESLKPYIKPLSKESE